MRKNELQRINNRLGVQRELIAHCEQVYLESYWKNEGDADYLYKLWQQAINEFNGMAELINTCFDGLTVENMEAH